MQLLLEREDVFELLKDQEQFVELTDSVYRDIFGEVFLDITIAEHRFREAHEHWLRDLKRVSDIEYDGDELDHFKQSGHLAYWLRRFAPVVECEVTPQGRQVESGNDGLSELLNNQKFLLQYANEHSAFEVGFRICRYFEWKRDDEPNTRIQAPTHDFILSICHFLKEKSVSPHAIFLIYKALFQ